MMHEFQAVKVGGRWFLHSEKLWIAWDQIEKANEFYDGKMIVYAIGGNSYEISTENFLAVVEAMRPDKNSAFTPEQRARIDAGRDKNRTPEERKREVELRALLAKEYEETGTLSASKCGD